MRNLPGLDPRLLEAADVQARQAPTYRFWGRKSPATRQRVPILDKQPPNQTDGSVATLRLYEPIDSWGGPWGVSAVEFMEVLDDLPEVGEIQLRINSPGGEVFEAIAILNALRNHPARVTAYVDGLAASAASFIAAGAEETVMGQNTELMIHDAWGLCIGNAQDMQKMADLLGHLSDNVASIYAAKAGGTTADWREAMLEETWYSADEAVAAGLADSVTAPAAGDPAPSDSFDLSLFQHAGRAAAPAPKQVGFPQTEVPVPDLEAHAERVARMQKRRHDLNAEKLGA